MTEYSAPRVLDSATLALEENLLAGSIVDMMGVEIAGQQTDGFYDLETGGSTFNHTWE